MPNTAREIKNSALCIEAESTPRGVEFSPKAISSRTGTETKRIHALSGPAAKVGLTPIGGDSECDKSI